MGIVSSEPLVLIGPGSEWFWTAISGIVVAITLVGLYFQLRMQRAAAAIEQTERIAQEWLSERMLRHVLAIYVALEAGTDPTAIPLRAAGAVGDFWDKVGFLARNGHIDGGLVHGEWGRPIQRWWAQLRPYALAQRGRIAAEVWIDFEWLAAEMGRLDARKGWTTRTDADDLVASIPGGLVHVREAIAVEEALRTVPVRIVTSPVEVRSVRAHTRVGPEPIAPEDIAAA